MSTAAIVNFRILITSPLVWSSLELLGETDQELGLRRGQRLPGLRAELVHVRADCRLFGPLVAALLGAFRRVELVDEPGSDIGAVDVPQRQPT